MEAFIADAEVVGHLVEHRLADLSRQTVRPAGVAEVFLAEDADPIRGGREVMHAAVLEHYTLIEPEQMSTVLGLRWSWPILNHDMEIVDLVDHPLR